MRTQLFNTLFHLLLISTSYVPSYTVELRASISSCLSLLPRNYPFSIDSMPPLSSLKLFPWSTFIHLNTSSVHRETTRNLVNTLKKPSLSSNSKQERRAQRLATMCRIPYSLWYCMSRWTAFETTTLFIEFSASLERTYVLAVCSPRCGFLGQLVDSPRPESLSECL